MPRAQLHVRPAHCGAGAIDVALSAMDSMGSTVPDESVGLIADVIGNSVGAVAATSSSAVLPPAAAAAAISAMTSAVGNASALSNGTMTKLTETASKLMQQTVVTDTTSITTAEKDNLAATATLRDKLVEVIGNSTTVPGEAPVVVTSTNLNVTVTTVKRGLQSSSWH